MAFSVTTLSSDMQDIFEAMDSNDDLAEGMATAINDFISTGTVTTTDAGTIATLASVFAGTGSGSLSVSTDTFETTLKAIFTAMDSLDTGGDTYLATQLGVAMQALSLLVSVSTNLTGILTNTATGVVTATTGSASGSIVCVSASFITTMSTLFSTMQTNKDNDDYDGNKDFADTFAQAVSDFFTTGLIATSGDSPLIGSVGSGTVA